MAKRGRKPKQKDTGTNGPAGGETTSAYFRRIFGENPSLLETRSNEELLNRWLADHSDQQEVPKNVKTALANVKGILRKKGRKKRGRKPAAVTAQAAETPSAATKPTKAASHRHLESLEEQIDECLSLAKGLDREGLESVINLLRKARNQVVWKMGE